MNTENTRIILASQSPRRKELLSRLFDDFEIIPSGAEEKPESTRPSGIVKELSEMKARDVYENVSKTADPGKDLLVIGADTIVSLYGDILGKPKDEDDAFRMIKSLSGKDHEVFTGVTLIYQKAGEEAKKVTFFEQTTVSFYKLTDKEILSYVRTGEPMDKAGAYAIQGGAGIFVERITGDWQNVVGLPVPRLYQELKALGL